MYYFVAALILLSGGFATLYQPIRTLPLEDKIVNGNDANIEDYPYQVSLLHDGRHICGSSILSPAIVVTATHCTDGNYVELLSIRAGSSIRDSNGSVVNVTKLYQNPNYGNFDYDISLLVLSSPLPLGNGIASISLPSQDQTIAVGSNATVTGWGKLRDGGVLASQLQVVQVKIISLEDCRNVYGENEITDRMICTGSTRGGKDACQGDSGGPLVINGQLIGIISAGLGCANPMYPGVYASVPALRTYITSISNL